MVATYEPDDDIDELLEYSDPHTIGGLELAQALWTLSGIGDDPYLRVQATNLSIVDQFIMQLEYSTLRKLNEEESTPMPEAVFLSAQSQMWIFAAYELLRTWREFAKDVLKLHGNGGLKLKIEALKKDIGYLHPGRSLRAKVLQGVLDDPTKVDTINDDLKLTHMTFGHLEYIRVALAKHQYRGKPNSIAYAPGYGRINPHCGALDYALENQAGTFGTINRRQIAESLRSMADRSNIPSDADIASFDAYIKGPPFSP